MSHLEKKEEMQSGCRSAEKDMRTERVERVVAEMKEMGLTQMVITDPVSIAHLAVHYENPMERFWALYLREDGAHKLIANRLFTLNDVSGIDILWYSDSEDGTVLLNSCIDHTKPLGVDKEMAARFLLRLMEQGAAPEYVNGSDCVDRIRAQKDEQERELMRASSQINDAAMAEFKKLIRPGVTELEIAEQMEGIYKRLGADGGSFGALVGFGANAANGHHGPDETVLKRGDCVLFDVGCKKEGYCSDMTRTFFFGEVSEAHRKVYETVLRAQEAAERAIRPGVKLSEIDRIARDIITEAGYGPYFTHRLGHFIGMEVHEKGDVSGGSELIAQPGMTFSIEPGIYLPGDVGVRIEDLVLVTETGVEILNHYTKELQVVEE